LDWSRCGLYSLHHAAAQPEAEATVTANALQGPALQNAEDMSKIASQQEKMGQ
jgi:hypothetical protein